MSDGKQSFGLDLHFVRADSMPKFVAKRAVLLSEEGVFSRCIAHAATCSTVNNATSFVTGRSLFLARPVFHSPQLICLDICHNSNRPSRSRPMYCCCIKHN